MRKFAFGLNRDFILESKTALLIKDMTFLSGLFICNK